MKYVTEYRDAALVRGVVDEIRRTVTRPWVIMEICGGQTHAIVRHGLDQILPPEIELVHGPGCPVCVTPLELIDKALAIASLPDVIFCSYGDMLRVPGSERDLFSVKASGGQVRVVYSPLDAVEIARQNPDKQVVFFAIGFETTAPANVMSVLAARTTGIEELFRSGFARACAACHARHSRFAIQPRAGIFAGGARLRGDGLSRISVAGGEIPRPDGGDRLRAARPGAGNSVHRPHVGRGPRGQWKMPTRARSPSKAISPRRRPSIRSSRNVTAPGAASAMIPMSGWRLRPEFAEFDAEKRFDVGDIQTKESPLCIAGQILLGMKKPHDCSAFGKECTPEHPLGATMVSSEGACAAYYKYKDDREGKNHEGFPNEAMTDIHQHRRCGLSRPLDSQRADRARARFGRKDVARSDP